MTEHYVTINPEDLQQVTEFAREEPDDGKSECPECGNRYVPGPGMTIHRKHAHGVGKKTATKSCPECGKAVRANDLARHRRTVHGTVLRGRTPQSNGHPDWNVDDIFASVISLMWPSGDIPIKAVMSLVRWREDTQHMLDEVTDAR